MQIENKTALLAAINTFRQGILDSQGLTIKSMNIDELTGELIVTYDDETTANLGVIKSEDGQPGKDGVSIIDVRLVEDALQNNQVFIETELSNGVTLQTQQSLSGYHGKSIVNAVVIDNQLVFELEATGETIVVPVAGLKPENIATVTAEAGNLLITLTDGTALAPVSVEGIQTNNIVSGEVRGANLIFTLEDGTELDTGVAGDLKGRDVLTTIKRDGMLYVTYSDAPEVEVEVGSLDGIESVSILEGNLQITLDSGQVTDLGMFMSLTGARIDAGELILTTNQPGTLAELNLGPVDGLKGQKGTGIKAVALLDNELVVTLTDDTVLPGLPISGLTPVSVTGARYDAVETELYLTLSDTTEVPTGLSADIRGRGITDATFNELTGEITITFANEAPVVVGTVPILTDVSLLSNGDLEVTWSNSETPVKLANLKTVVAITESENGNIVATWNDETTSVLGNINTIASAALVGTQLKVTYTDGTVVDLGSVKGEKGDSGIGFVSAVINAAGNLIVTNTEGVELDAGFARTTTQSLVGRTVTPTITAGQTEFTLDHGGVGTVVAFRNKTLLSESELNLSINDTVGYANGTDLVPTDEMMFIIYTPGSNTTVGRGVNTIVPVTETAYMITLEDGTESIIETKTPIDESLIPAGVTGARVEPNGDLVLTFDKGPDINAGKANKAVNTKSAAINPSGDLILTLDDDTTINVGSVVSDLTISNATVNEAGELIITLNTGSEFNAGRTGTYVTNARIDENDKLQITLSTGQTIDAGSVRNPLLGSRYDSLAFEGQVDFPIVHDGFEIMFYANGASLSKESLILTDPNKVTTRQPRKENDVITILLIGTGNSLATGLVGQSEAPNDTTYSKDIDGVIGWHPNQRTKIALSTKYLAEEGQTTFLVTHGGSVNVFLNGAMESTSYELPVTNDKVVFTTPLSAGDEVVIEVLTAPRAAADLLAGRYARVSYDTFQPGGTFVAGAWQVRKLNMILTNNIGLTITNNRIVLPAGKYYIDGYAAASGVRQNALRLFNTTTSETSLQGAGMFAPQGNATYDTPEQHTPISGYVELSVQSAIVLQHMCAQTVYNYGFGTGNAGGRSSSLPVELLGIAGRLVDLQIWQVG